jgi:hypothetical protein
MPPHRKRSRTYRSDFTRLPPSHQETALSLLTIFLRRLFALVPAGEERPRPLDRRRSSRRKRP